jgi:hypothetical protein
VTQSAQSDPTPEIDVLRRENAELRQLNCLLALKVEKPIGAERCDKPRLRLACRLLR